MKNQFKKLAALLVIVLINSSCKHRAENSVIPAEWNSTSDAEVDSNPKLENSVDKILSVHAEVLNQTNAQNGAWQLSGMIFEMAVSFEGVLGILLGEGEGSVKTTWVRNEVKSSYQNLAKNAKPISFTFHSKDSDQSIEKKSQLISDMAIATGKVRDPQLLKTNLMFKFNQFIEMGKLLNVNELKESGWKLTEFREVLSISAEGDVAPAIALGGLLEFEMRWNVEKEEEGEQNFTGILSRRRPSLEGLLNGLVSDLKIAENESASEYEENGFELDGFYVELGVKGEADFGIASGAASAAGKLVFERIAEEELSDASKKIKDSTTSMSDVSIISEAPGPISFTAQSSSQFHQVARADHHVFRRGLHRALKMGRFFARRASRVEGKKWRIQEIEPEFEIAVHGNLGLVNVEGNAALSLEFERKESK